MKNKYNTYTFASNGFSYRTRNKRLTVVEQKEKVFTIEFLTYQEKVGETALTGNRLRLASTVIKLSEEILEALSVGFLEYQRRKLEK